MLFRGTLSTSFFNDNDLFLFSSKIVLSASAIILSVSGGNFIFFIFLLFFGKVFVSGFRKLFVAFTISFIEYIFINN